MLQQFLPDIGPKLLPVKHYHWFKMANAHPNQFWKKAYWYPFKEKFLAKYGMRDGYDLQVILHHCWNCNDGSCGQCNDGIYRRVEVPLERWLLPVGDVFHRPDHTYHGSVFKNTFNGLLKHGEVSESQAVRACIRLLFCHDRLAAISMVERQYVSFGKIVSPINMVRWRIRNQWINLHNQFFHLYETQP